MLQKKRNVKRIVDQTPAEKMQILSGEARLRQGKSFTFYQKIRNSDTDLSFLKNTPKALFNQMKATKAALDYMKKHTDNKIFKALETTEKEINKYSSKSNSLQIESLITNNDQLLTMIPEGDAIIIQWTPLKFLCIGKFLREKGEATVRHTEGLIAKLLFKVVGYYSDPENWDISKLTFYLDKLTPELDYNTVSVALEPIRKDIADFIQAYQVIKFNFKDEGTSLIEIFEEQLIQESTDTKLRTLYWHQFIYKGVKQFILQYYLILISSAKNIYVIQCLSREFEPILSHSIMVYNLFLGSFETEPSKKKLLPEYEAYKKQQSTQQESRLISIQEGIFESYYYNLDFLEKTNLSYKIKSKLKKNSNWGHFLKQYILNKIQEKSESVPIIEIESDITKLAILELFSCLIRCKIYDINSLQNIIDQLKLHMEKEENTKNQQIEKIQAATEKDIAKMEKQLLQFERLGQTEAYKKHQLEIDKYKIKLKMECDAIENKKDIIVNEQKEKLQVLLDHISEEIDFNDGEASKHLFQLLLSLVPPDQNLKNEMIKFTIQHIRKNYFPELIPFYQNIFYIYEPTTQYKVVLIQTFESLNLENKIILKLNDEERKAYQEKITQLRLDVQKKVPDIFKYKLLFQEFNIPLQELIELRIDNNSLNTLLNLKIALPGKAPIPTPNSIKQCMMFLNSVENPVPQHYLILKGRENMQPENAINHILLKKLISKGKSS